MHHYIHCHQGFDPNKGGTVGYLSSLLTGFEELGTFHSAQDLRHSFLFPNIGPKDRIPNLPLEYLKEDSPFSDAYLYEANNNTRLHLDRKDWFHSVLPSQELLKINLQKITSIHIHGAYNFLPIYNTLRLAGIENDVVKILTTHNPHKPELEDMECLSRGMKKENREAIRFYHHYRDHKAFSLADALVFPCEYSMEGYYKSWPEFKDIIKNKPVYFSLTGTEEKEVSTPANILRKQLNIPPNATVFLFLGRFMKIRGFDLYIEAAKKILEEIPGSYFLAVGEKQKTPSIDHPCWIEVPFTDAPGSFINMADACIIANRGSYFDLSMIENLSLGTPLIAAKVGGYKYLENKTTGVQYFKPESTTELIAAIKKFIQLSEKKKEKMRQSNIALYQKKLTPKHFAQGYLDTIDKLYSDFKISKTKRNLVRIPTYIEIEKKEHLGPNKKIAPPTRSTPPPPKPIPTQHRLDPSDFSVAEIASAIEIKVDDFALDFKRLHPKMTIALSPVWRLIRKSYFTAKEWRRRTLLNR